MCSVASRSATTVLRACWKPWKPRGWSGSCRPMVHARCWLLRQAAMNRRQSGHGIAAGLLLVLLTFGAMPGVAAPAGAAAPAPAATTALDRYLDGLTTWSAQFQQIVTDAR